MRMFSGTDLLTIVGFLIFWGTTWAMASKPPVKQEKEEREQRGNREQSTALKVTQGPPAQPVEESEIPVLTDVFEQKRAPSALEDIRAKLAMADPAQLEVVKATAAQFLNEDEMEMLSKDIANRESELAPPGVTADHLQVS